MHIWIVIAALTFAAVTPFLGAPSRTDVAQMMDDLSSLEDAAEEADDNEHSA